VTAFVGLTGGIASGKSTVGRIFRSLGVTVVDADEVAREVVERGSEGLAEVVAAFGDVLTEEGALDRKKVAAIVFDDPDARRRLERITHPRIFARSMQRMAEAASRGEPLAVYEAALLVENGSYKMFQALVVVAATASVQVSRVATRDGIDEVGARARMAAQMPLEKKIEVADYVIWNDGDLAALEAKTRDVYTALLARFGG
jgi:dephospho-CoA kinase